MTIINGTSGNDILTGGAGADSFSGLGSIDTFVFAAGSSTLTGQMDVPDTKKPRSEVESEAGCMGFEHAVEDCGYSQIQSRRRTHGARLANPRLLSDRSQPRTGNGGTAMGIAIRIAAVDDHPFFLDGVRRALSRAIDLNLVAQGSSSAHARLIANERQPDIMLLDIDIPGGGIEAARAIMAGGSLIKIIMLTASNNDEHVAAAFAAGAQGYVLKGADTAELLEAIRLGPVQDLSRRMDGFWPDRVIPFAVE